MIKIEFTFCIMLVALNLLGQVDEVVDDIQESYDYYQSAMNKINDGLGNISQCYSQNSISGIQLYAGFANTDINSAKWDVGYAEDKASNAKYKASNNDCDNSYYYTNNAEDYFYSAETQLSNALSQLSSASYENDIDYLSDHLNSAKSYIRQAINNLNYALDELRYALSNLDECQVNSSNYSSSDVSCNDLYQFINDNGYFKGKVSSYTMNSSWLKTVTAYTYDYKIYVVAEIKESEYSYRSKSYIFCDIPSSNWRKFKNGSYSDSNSYGERFHKYIFNHKCDCS